MNQNTLKKQAAERALEYVKNDMVLGVGTGSTVDFFIEGLAAIKHRIEATIASSVATEKKLKAHAIPVIDLNSAAAVDLYVDGADEADQRHNLIKGGGGALLREKILATAANQFICIIDESKQVDYIGQGFPLPIEVIPMARSLVAREIVKLGGNPCYREKFVTDNGNVILDVTSLKMLDPVKLEQELNNITGVVENGIFAKRKPEKILVARETSVEELLL